MTSKISKHHLQKKAFVYIRQSTPDQVEKHGESTKRQYELTTRAQALGWHNSQIFVLDADLGKTGTESSNRRDFQRLVAEVGLGEVGAVLALEVSRFSRNLSDWHRLLDICALTDTLIIDADYVYSPNDFNDRTLLGLKGTWSQTELHSIMLRMQGARLSKVKRADLRFDRPVGFVHGSEGLVFDPDESVVSSVKLLFRKFDELGSAYKVASYFEDNDLLFPSREWSVAELGPVKWGKLGHCRTVRILRNPTYAGAYVYGRKRQKKQLQTDGTIKTQRVKMDEKDWIILKRDHHQGYIDWNRFIENGKKLTANAIKNSYEGYPPNPRKGTALLGGLVMCGRCGRHMGVKYGRVEHKHSLAYICEHTKKTVGVAHCWEVSNRLIDQSVEKRLLELLTMENLELSLAVLREVEDKKKEENKNWLLRIERAKYETIKAERQYNYVEPENRVVARTLESRWNEKLSELEELEKTYEIFKGKKSIRLTSEERTRIVALAKDIPGLWRAKSTTSAERKEILNLFIRQVSLTPIDIPKRQTKIKILWHTGKVDELFVDRPVAGKESGVDLAVIPIIEKMANKSSDAQIAECLNKRGFKNHNNLPFKKNSIMRIRFLHGIRRPATDLRFASTTEPRFDGLYSTRYLLTRLQVSATTVCRWRREGKLTGIQKEEHGPWWYKVTEHDIARLVKERAKLKADKRRKKLNMFNKKLGVI